MKLFQLNMEACVGRVYWKFHHHDKDSQLHDIKEYFFKKGISFESGRMIEIKNHMEGRDDNVLQISLVRCNSVNHEELKATDLIVRRPVMILLKYGVDV